MKMTSQMYQLKKSYREVQAEAEKASTLADGATKALAYADLCRKAERLSVAASLIHQAMVQIDEANMTGVELYFAHRTGSGR